MEKLETVVEQLRKQSPSQWTQVDTEKDYYLNYSGVEKGDEVSTEYKISIESRDYSITRTRKLKEILRFELLGDSKRKSVIFYDPKEDKEVILTNENLERGIPLWESQNGKKFPCDEAIAFCMKYIPDTETNSYCLTVTRIVSDNGTTISEHLEYRNDQILSGLFDSIND